MLVSFESNKMQDELKFYDMSDTDNLHDAEGIKENTPQTEETSNAENTEALDANINDSENI